MMGPVLVPLWYSPSIQLHTGGVVVKSYLLIHRDNFYIWVFHLIQEQGNKTMTFCQM